MTISGTVSTKNSWPKGKKTTVNTKLRSVLKPCANQGMVEEKNADRQKAAETAAEGGAAE